MDLNDLNNEKEWETPEEGETCPKCDGELIRRHARNLEGREFLGCSNFPLCNFIQLLE